MLRNLLLTIGIVLTANVLVFSQSGSLKGKIVDKQTKEPIPFANVVVEIGGIQMGGATSDFDGNYLIKPVPPGKVDLKATFVGYNDFIMKGVVIFVDKITFQDVELQVKTTTLNEVEVVDYKVPLISKDQTVSGGTVTQDEIAKMANKSADAVASTVGGVTTNASGGISSIRGARSDGTVYYIDGMRVYGSNSLPQSAIEQVEVILGGTPASYGDATGGIISVTTRGPSRDFSGGVDMQTSTFLDPFGYNRVGLNATGPLFSKKDTITHTKTPIMGYFIGGDFSYNKDGSPNATGIYKGKDDYVKYISETPLRLTPSGDGIYMNAEFMTKDDMEKVYTTMNSSNYNVALSGKLDFRLSKTINLSFGGQLSFYDNNNFSYGNSLLNWDNNSHSSGYNWRVNGRFTQRFPSTDDKSFVKNVNYSIGADFTRNYAKSEDADHKDNLFKYGYVGKFETSTIRAYDTEMELDTVSGKYAYKQNGFRDVVVNFTPSSVNPESSNWTQQYFDLFPDATGHYENLDDILAGRGLLNGMEPLTVYSLWSSPGDGYNYYAVSTSDQIAVNASFAADFGNHEVQLGLQYQQRSSGAYNYAPVTLWSVMRGLTNAHLAELDIANPYLVYRDGEFMDTINYHRKYVEISQRNFDINLREKLGLAVDGVDYIDIDSYDFDKNTINYYDADQNLHTIHIDEDMLSIDMFNADELLNGGSPLVYYRGYDFLGNKLTSKPSFEDFFYAVDDNGNYTRPVGNYEPIYVAGYIQDKFAFKDLIFNVGLRIDRFDANQMVLKDPYLFYEAKTAGEVTSIEGSAVTHPSNIGSNYVVYVDDANNPSAITGYRYEDKWYNAEGSVITDPTVLDRGNGVSPYLVDSENKTVTPAVFKDYEPQLNFMPRISFSFPISDEALFYAHYDILTQRPTTGIVIDPVSYYYINVIGSSGTINNPALQPEKTIDYELGFQQKINNASSIKLAMFYREQRDQIQQYRLTGAYPKTYYSYTNIDFGTVKGLTFTYDLRRTGNARVRFNYTLQFADGTGSDPDAASAIIRSDQPNLRTLNPLAFDRRHQFNVSVDYRFGSGKEYNGPVINRKNGKAPLQILSNLGANFTVTGGSGTPYTKSSEIKQYGQMGAIQGSINGARLPWQFNINLRIDKDFNFSFTSNKKKTNTINVYLEVLNLFNTQNVTSVYAATGSAYDDGYLSATEWQTQIESQINPSAYRDLYSAYIENPYNYSTPRQIRLGLQFSF